MSVPITPDDDRIHRDLHARLHAVAEPQRMQAYDLQAVTELSRLIEAMQELEPKLNHLLTLLHNMERRAPPRPTFNEPPPEPTDAPRS